RFQKQWMVVVTAGAFRARQIGDVHNPKARVPAARPHLLAKAQRMMKAVPPARPGRHLAARDVLPRHPPPRNFLRFARIAQIVNDEDIPDVSFHFGRDVGMPLIHIEAMHADAAGPLITNQLRLRRFGDVVNLETAVRIATLLEFFQCRQIVLRDAHFGGDFASRRLARELLGQGPPRGWQLLAAAAGLAHIALVIDDHDVTHNAHLMAVRFVILERDRGDDARLTRIDDIDDGRSQMIRIGNVADKGMRTADRDLPAAGEIEMPQTADVAGKAGSRSVNRVHVRFSRATPKSWVTPCSASFPRSYTNCTVMQPSVPKSACSVSPLFATTTRVNEPASTRWPASSATPWLASLLASQATPSAGWPSTPAATPVSSISEFLYMMPPTQRRSTSSGPTGRPPITMPAAAPLSATVSKILRGSCRRASTISIAGTTYSVARSTSGRVTPGPLSGLPRMKASSISTRGLQKLACGILAPSAIIMSSSRWP